MCAFAFGCGLGARIGVGRDRAGGVHLGPCPSANQTPRTLLVWQSGPGGPFAEGSSWQRCHSSFLGVRELLGCSRETSCYDDRLLSVLR